MASKDWFPPRLPNSPETPTPSAVRPQPLAEIEWTEGIVREEIQTMLLAESPPLSALDLLLAYDKDPDGEGPHASNTSAPNTSQTLLP